MCYGKECPKNLIIKESSRITTRVKTRKEMNNLSDNDSNKSYSNTIEMSNESLTNTSIPSTSIVTPTTRLSRSINPDNNFEVKIPQKLPIIPPRNLTSDSFLTRFRNHKCVSDADMRDYKTREIYLFVVNFHFRNYTYAAFIRQGIYRLFADKYPYDFDLLLIGPTLDIKNKVFTNELPERGYYAYHSMRVAIDLFPPEAGYTYAGYFEANDDSCLQPTLLGKEDHNKAMSEVWFPWTPYNKWPWNVVKNKNNKVMFLAYLNAVSEIESKPTLHNLCKVSSSQLRHGWSDFFYFPKSNLTTFLELESVMYKHYVFLENAVPFIMDCFKANVITDCNHGKMPDREVCPHLHPVKFTRSRERRICVNRILNITLSERPDTWCICLFNLSLYTSITIVI